MIAGLSCPLEINCLLMLQKKAVAGNREVPFFQDGLDPDCFIDAVVSYIRLNSRALSVIICGFFCSYFIYQYTKLLIWRWGLRGVCPSLTSTACVVLLSLFTCSLVGSCWKKCNVLRCIAQFVFPNLKQNRKTQLLYKEGWKYIEDVWST